MADKLLVTLGGLFRLTHIQLQAHTPHTHIHIYIYIYTVTQTHIILIIITTSYTPISSKIKLNGATKPRD